MRAAVLDWREKFNAPLLPFFNVELAACNNCKKMPFLCHFILDMIILPGQARDKHTGKTQKSPAFLQTRMQLTTR
jgi:hypothetical protein